jgi:hypothetical protein
LIDFIHIEFLDLLKRGVCMATQSPQRAALPESSASAPDRVLGITRVLAAIIVPILLAAFIMLYLFPNDSGRLFAWPIKPPLSAMLLGATYLGGAYFFTRVFLARQWHTVRLGLIPVTTFAGILGIATLLHWDKFTHGHISFILWAFLYFTLPFVIPVVWYRNQRVNQNQPPDAEKQFSSGLRLAIGAIGAVMLLSSAILLIFPQLMIPIWPWTLSPLTARVMAAMFALPGLVGLGVALDGRWSSASIIFQAQAIAIFFFLMAIALNRDEVQWGQLGSWTFLGGLLLVVVLIALAAWEANKRQDRPGIPSRKSLDLDKP